MKHTGLLIRVSLSEAEDVLHLCAGIRPIGVFCLTLICIFYEFCLFGHIFFKGRMGISEGLDLDPVVQFDTLEDSCLTMFQARAPRLYSLGPSHAAFEPSRAAFEPSHAAFEPSHATSPGSLAPQIRILSYQLYCVINRFQPLLLNRYLWGLVGVKS